ncbi:hypothetical protein U1Q18_015058, partial [Sarracenia purpurea var. burkii]
MSQTQGEVDSGEGRRGFEGRGYTCKGKTTTPKREDEGFLQRRDEGFLHMQRRRRRKKTKGFYKEETRGFCTCKGKTKRICKEERRVSAHIRGRQK